jgi:hypothetical protein
MTVVVVHGLPLELLLHWDGHAGWELADIIINQGCIIFL